MSINKSIHFHRLEGITPNNTHSFCSSVLVYCCLKIIYILHTFMPICVDVFVNCFQQPVQLQSNCVRSALVEIFWVIWRRHRNTYRNENFIFSVGFLNYLTNPYHHCHPDCFGLFSKHDLIERAKGSFIKFRKLILPKQMNFNSYTWV